jgi:hypothetical protein
MGMLNAKVSDADVVKMAMSELIKGTAVMARGVTKSVEKVEPITIATAPYCFSLGVDCLNIKGKNGKVVVTVPLSDYEVNVMARLSPLFFYMVVFAVVQLL